MITEDDLTKAIKAHYEAAKANMRQPDEFSIRMYMQMNDIDYKQACRLLDEAIKLGELTKRIGISDGKSSTLYRFCDKL